MVLTPRSRILGSQVQFLLVGKAQSRQFSIGEELPHLGPAGTITTARRGPGRKSEVVDLNTSGSRSKTKNLFDFKGE